MDSPDSGSGAIPLLSLWGALSRRLAVAAGAATALIALLFDVPLSQACLRGGFAWLLTRVLATGVAQLLERTSSEPIAAESPAADDQPSEAEPEPNDVEAA